MKNLMHCFEDTFVTVDERAPGDEFSRGMSNTHPDKKIVTKKPGSGIEIYNNCPGINVICMYRDPRDMYCSRRPAAQHSEGSVIWWVDNERRNPGGFGSAVEGYLRMLQHPRTLAVRYEELVSEPDKVQEEIAERFGLTSRHPFSQGHEVFLPEKTDRINFAMNGIRPPDTNSIGRWKTDRWIGMVREWIKENPTILEFIREMGYEEE